MRTRLTRSQAARSALQRLTLLGLLSATAALGAPLAAEAASTPTENDLKALVYFLRQGDDHAAAAEKGRLRELYPEWIPPADLASIERAPRGEEIDAIYRRIAANELVGARAGMEALDARFAGWTPPPDMLELLEIAEGQKAFDAALARGAVTEAGAMLRRIPALRDCSRVNNVWRLAEALANDGDAEAALRAHRGVVSACADAAHVRASIEKSASFATAEQVQSLIDVAKRRFPDEAEALDQLAARLLAGMGLAADPALERPAAAAPSEKTEAPTAQRRPSPSAPSPAPTPQARAEAAGKDLLPLEGDDRIEGVRAAARDYDWRECLKRSTRPQSIDVLYERSWCNMNMARPAEALLGFRQTAERSEDDRVARDARYGAALAFLARGMTNDAAVVAARTDLTLAQRRIIEAQILDQRAVLSFENGDYRHAVAYLDALDALVGGLRRDLAMLRGWALLRGGDRDRANAEFRRLHDQIRTPDTLRALRATARRLE